MLDVARLDEVERLRDVVLERFGQGDFCIICPDNDVSVAVDSARVRWHSDDIVDHRLALSRWHPDWAERFAAFVVERT